MHHNYLLWLIALATNLLTLFLDPTQILFYPWIPFRGQVGPAKTRWRHSAPSIPIRNTARNRPPGATNRRPRPLVRALVGAVIGSSAI